LTSKTSNLTSSSGGELAWGDFLKRCYRCYSNDHGLIWYLSKRLHKRGFCFLVK
jgi:hypothetical protein